MKGRAKQLLSVGVKTPQDLAKADPLDLCRQVEHLYPKQARKLVAAAKVWLEGMCIYVGVSIHVNTMPDSITI